MSSECNKLRRMRRVIYKDVNVGCRLSVLESEVYSAGQIFQVRLEFMCVGYDHHLYPAVAIVRERLLVEAQGYVCQVHGCLCVHK